MQELIKLLRKLAPEAIAASILDVQPMPNIDFKAMCDEDEGIDVTWMLMNGYEKRTQPVSHHGLLTYVSWVKEKTCTWYKCEETYTHIIPPRKDGKIYIKLCNNHNNDLDAAYYGANPHRLSKILKLAKGEHVEGLS